MLISMTLILVMALGTRVSFESGFVRYLSQVELKQLDPLAAALEDSWARYGDWRLLRRNHNSWMRHLTYVSLDDIDRPKGLPSQIPDFFTRPQRGPQFIPPETGLSRRPGVGPPPAPPGDPSALSHRLRLLDTNKTKIIIGPPDNSGKMILRPLTVNDQLIGYLGLTPLPWPEDELARSFSKEQNQVLLLISVIASILALIMAVIVGRQIVKPVKALAGAAASLRQGHFNTRLELVRSDELGRLIEDFNQLASTLEQNEALRRHAMADISHELRTPLAVLRAEIEATQDGYREYSEEQMQLLHDNVLGLGRLVDDLHELALSDSGALNYRMEPVDVSEIVRASVLSMKTAFLDRQVRLLETVEDSLLTIADKRRIRQVIDNLLKNSLRYTDSNGQCEVRAMLSSGQIVIVVRDSSPGVSDHDLAHLTERFYRAEASRNRRTGGSGLGLAISNNIIEVHGGTITLDHSDIGGLQVTLRIPVNQAGGEG